MRSCDAHPFLRTKGQGLRIRLQSSLMSAQQKPVCMHECCVHVYVYECVCEAYRDRATCLMAAGLLGASVTALWKSSRESEISPSCLFIKPVSGSHLEIYAHTIWSHTIVMVHSGGIVWQRCTDRGHIWHIHTCPQSPAASLLLEPVPP